MNECVYGIKILSNMITIKFSENDIFMKILKTHISKNFSSVMNLRHSTFIFHRDGEDLRRRIFLNWMHNLYTKGGTQTDKNMLDNLIKNQKLTICMQIVPKSKIIETIKLFSYFLGNRILFRATDVNNQFFAYLKSAFRNHKLGIKHEGQNLYLDMSTTDSVTAQRIKRIFAQKLSLAGKNFTLMYNQKEFELFFGKFEQKSSGQHSSQSNYSRSSYQNYSNNQKSQSDEIETLTTSQRMARYLRILGCSENEDMSMIKKRYFSLAKEYHPDMHHGKDESAIKILTEKFIQVKNAYDFLVEMKSGEAKAA